MTPTPGDEHRSGRLAVAAAVFGIGLGLDQWSKRWAFAQLHARPPRVVIDDVLTLEYAFNPGSAFGMLADEPRARLWFVTITVFALLYIGALLWRLPGRPRSRAAALNASVALGLMAAGALGNLLDRLLRVDEVRVRLGDELPFWLLVEQPTRLAESLTRGRNWIDVPRHGVVDFIVVDYGAARPWPAFNLADSWLVVGVGLFVIFLALQGGFGARTAGDEAEPV